MGNVQSITDALAGPQTQSFGYDALDRLTSASASGGTDGLYSESYTYDAATGNLASKAEVSYTYSDTLHAHAVSLLSNGDSFLYDANGNMTQRNVGGSTYNLTHDAENRLVGVTGAITATFKYDGDGNRVQGTVDGMTTTYIGNYYEWTGEITTTVKYYYAGATRIVMRVGNGTQTEGLYWLLSDYLGSTAVTTDGAGNKSGEVRYKAWGETRFISGSTPTTFRFTWQRQEKQLGLYFYNARWYDPALGRFIQADTLVPGPGNSQAWDSYAYTLNNPLKYADPTGFFTEDEIIKFLGVDSWDDVLALFEKGGKLEGKWGWLEVLRQAENGDEIYFINRENMDNNYNIDSLTGGVFDVNNGKLTIGMTNGEIFNIFEAASGGDYFVLKDYLKNNSESPVMVNIFPQNQKYFHRIEIANPEAFNELVFSNLIGEAMKFALGGTATLAVGGILLASGAQICTSSVVGCVAGAPLFIGGGGALYASSVIYTQWFNLERELFTNAFDLIP